MALMVAVFITGQGLSSHDELESVMNDIERAVLFATDEATLRGRIIRIRFNLNEDPQEWRVEVGPGNDFLLPLNVKMQGPESEEEREAFSQAREKLNKQFSKIREFGGGLLKLPNSVSILGVGLSSTLQTEGENSLYFYPTGEKDPGLLILGTREDIGLLEIEAFTTHFVREIVPLERAPEEDWEFEDKDDRVFKAQQKHAQKIFEGWLK